LQAEGFCTEALLCYDIVCHLVPGSRLETEVAQIREEMAAQLAARRDHLAAATDEEEALPPSVGDNRAELWQVMRYEWEHALGVLRAAIAPPSLERASPNNEGIHKPRAKLKRAVYSVSDLVKHNPCRDGEVLVQVIKSNIEPKSWFANGGPATIDYFLPRKALVVNQTPGAQEKIMELLTTLRRLHDLDEDVEEQLAVPPEQPNPCSGWQRLLGLIEIPQWCAGSKPTSPR
jgi:hypothetical protein